MFSAYFVSEIQLTEKIATLEGGKQQTIVLHAELENLILGQEVKIHFDYPVVIPSVTDAVVTCKMWDDKGRCVVAIGEATENTRSSGIANNYGLKT